MNLTRTADIAYKILLLKLIWICEKVFFILSHHTESFLSEKEKYVILD